MGTRVDKLKSLGNLWRAGRKLRGYSQTDISEKLGLSQGTISKYENGILESSAWDWFNFCQLIRIDAHRSLENGYIDMCQPFQKNLYQDSLLSIEPSLQDDAPLVKIRELQPFKSFSIDFFGQKVWDSFLSKIHLDPHVFYIYDYQVSADTLFSLIGLIGERVAVKSRAFDQLLSYAVESFSSGEALNITSNCLIEDVVGIQQRLYTQVFEWKVKKLDQSDDYLVLLDLSNFIKKSYPSNNSSFYLHYKTLMLEKFICMMIKPATKTKVLCTIGGSRGTICVETTNK